MQILERDLDKAFLRRLKNEVPDAVAIKLSTLGRYGSAGWPDRLVLLPGGRAIFIELKAPGKNATPLQSERLHALHNIGFVATVAHTVAEAMEVVRANL